MPFDEMRRRQQAIARRRKKRKFSLLLSQITVPSPHYTNYDEGGRGSASGKLKYAILSVAPVMLVLWLFFGRTSQQQETLLSQTVDRSTVRNKYWRANVLQEQNSDEETTDEDGDSKKEKLFQKMGKSSSRPFNYIGDIDPTEPRPWPEEEKDWWKLHETLANKVRDSDKSSSRPFDINNDSRLPQLVFFGDSITEGWGGTSFGNVPGKHRMWTENEHKEIRDLFKNTFGEDSKWGIRALKPPLVLGISGSRTYDFLWRIENGEFPKSKLLEGNEDKREDGEENTEDDDVTLSMFQLDKLERIYIVLMGTNNIGGGMLPGPTVKGMDAVGRAILQLHENNFPNTPAAMLFSELLARKDDFRAEKMCPPRCANVTTLEPYKHFMPAINKVNRALPDVVDGWRKDFENSRIVLLSSSEAGSTTGSNDGDEKENDDAASKEANDVNSYSKTIHCGRAMFAIDNEDGFDTYMPDRLHPNAKGYTLWSSCIMKGLEEVMDHSIHMEKNESKS